MRVCQWSSRVSSVCVFVAWQWLFEKQRTKTCAAVSSLLPCMRRGTESQRDRGENKSNSRGREVRHAGREEGTQ